MEAINRHRIMRLLIRAEEKELKRKLSVNERRWLLQRITDYDPRTITEFLHREAYPAQRRKHRPKPLIVEEL